MLPFASAGQAVEELEALNTEVEQLEADEKRVREFPQRKSSVLLQETISQTVKQRKEEITKKLRCGLGKVQDRLKSKSEA